MAGKSDKTLIQDFVDDLTEEFFENDDDMYDLSNSSSSSVDSLSLERNHATRIENYLGVIKHYNDKEFVRHFRLTRTTVDFLIEDIRKAEVMSSYKAGRENVTPEEAVYISIWYLSNTETFRQLSDRFNKTPSTIYNCVKTIIRYLVKISSQYIKWPTNISTQEEIVKGFYKKQKVNGVLGAIDGCHITITRPKENQEAYCNRKGYHSILLQGIVDHEKRFIDVFCGEPGSIHDARLLKKSKIYEKIMNKEIYLENYYLIGNSAYPNLPWLVTPFKDNGRLTMNQRQFNFKISSTRMVVENAFGLLKGRFRRLKFFENKNIKLISACVVAATVLHNIAINMEGSNQPEYLLEDVTQDMDSIASDETEDVRRRDHIQGVSR